MTHVLLTANNLEGLRVRVRIRRLGLPMRSVYLASVLAVRRAMLQQWEQRLPASLEAPLQDMWERLLEVPPCWLMDARIHADDETVPQRMRIPEGRHPTIADAIRGVGQLLAQYHGVRTDMEHKDYPAIMQRNAELFAMRYGVRDNEQAAFNTAATLQGISRQRAPQVINKMLLRSAQ